MSAQDGVCSFGTSDCCTGDVSIIVNDNEQTVICSGNCYSTVSFGGSYTIPDAVTGTSSSPIIYATYEILVGPSQAVDFTFNIDQSCDELLWAVAVPNTGSCGGGSSSSGSSFSFRYSYQTCRITMSRTCGTDDVRADESLYLSVYIYGDITGSFSVSSPYEAANYGNGCTFPPTLSPTASPTNSPTTNPTTNPTISPTVATTAAPTPPLAPPPFSININAYTDGYCSDFFGELSVLNGIDGCYSETVDGTVVSAYVHCSSNDLSSQWVSNIFPNSDCSGSAVATFTGYGSDECAYLSAYGYTVSMRVNCANGGFDTTSSSSSSSGGDDAGAIAGGVVGAILGIALLAGIAYYFLKFKPSNQKESLDKDGNAL